MLREYDLGWAYLPADRGYDYEMVYRAAEEAGLTSIIKKQDRPNGKKSKYRKRSMYRETLYRALRHLVENNFGGLEHRGMLTTSIRKAENVAKYGVIIHLRQTLFAYLRQTVFSLFQLIMRQTPKFHKAFIPVFKQGFNAIKEIHTISKTASLQIR